MLQFLMTRTKLMGASLAAVFVVSMVFIGFTNNAEAHTISDNKVDKEFVLCAIDTTEQLVAPDNDITPGGIINENSWTFVLIDATDIEEVDPLDYPTVFHDLDELDAHAAINGHSN